MVRIEITRHKIKATGHAMSGEKGKDLVCCAVSTMLQMMEVGINPRFMKVLKKEPGDLEYQIYEPSSPPMVFGLMARLDFVIKGLERLAEENPEHVEVIKLVE